MLQHNAFCGKMQNATAAGASPRTPGAYSAPSDPLAGTKGAQNKFAALRGKEGKGWWEWKGKGKRGRGEGGRRRGEKLEQGRQLAKAGPSCHTA